MLEEAITSFNMTPPIAITESDTLRKMNCFCAGRVPVFVHPSLYRALKLTFPWDIGGISQDGTINTEMGHGSMGEAVGILTPAMFKAGKQP